MQELPGLMSACAGSPVHLLLTLLFEGLSSCLLGPLIQAILPVEINGLPEMRTDELQAAICVRAALSAWS
eukprot:5940313-Amphidinium_carterae.1